MYKSFHRVRFLLVKYLGVELQGHIGNVSLALQESDKCFSKAVV